MISQRLPPKESPRIFSNAFHRFTPVPAPVSQALSRLLQFEELDRIYAELRECGVRGKEFAAYILASLGVTFSVPEADQRRIPRTGPVLLAANHPFGMIEGAVLAAVLPRLRPDVKILANSLLGQFDELRDLLILVNPFGGEEATRENLRGMREALAWLEQGHFLAVFPAGEVSSFDPRKRAITDPAWSPSIARLLRRTRAAAVPAYFGGANSLLFQLAGLIHPRLRTALLPHEVLNKRRHHIELRLGHPIPARKLASFASDDAVTAHLRERSYWLSERGRKRSQVWRPRRPAAALADAVPVEWLRTEVAGLPPSSILLESGGLQVLRAKGHEIPLLLLELGRERERAFRLAGEGTGAPRDLDRFDTWYTHIVLWHAETGRVAGAYRLCGTDEAGGGLYTETLFRFAPEFFSRLGQALEMGRSFVAPEYQRSYQPLLLLWRGIGRHLTQNPRYRALFGPVSISNEYQTASRDLIAGYLRCAALDTNLAPLVAARKPFHSTPHRHLLRTQDIDEVESAVADVEPDAKGIPVLVRQYLRLGGRIAALHVDQHFGNTLDGLIVLDLLKADRKALERYLEPEGLAEYLAAQQPRSAA